MPNPVPPPTPPFREGTGQVPHPDPRTLYVTDAHADETAPKNGRTQLIGLVITIVGVTTAAVVCAAKEHDGIKDWTAERDYATKNEVVDIVEKHYVPTDDFVEVKTEQRNIKEKVNEINCKVNDIDSKVDEMHQLLIRGRRPSRHDRNDDDDRND